MRKEELKTKKGKVVEAKFFKKNKKEWVNVRFFAYNINFDFCLQSITINEILDYLDDNFEKIENQESDYLDDIMRCYD